MSALAKVMGLGMTAVRAIFGDIPYFDERFEFAIHMALSE